jgi:hypothetical protein
MEHNDGWQTQNRYMQIEGFAEPAEKTAHLKPLQITPKAAWPMNPSATPENYTTLTDVTSTKSTASAYAQRSSARLRICHLLPSLKRKGKEKRLVKTFADHLQPTLALMAERGMEALNVGHFD